MKEGWCEEGLSTNKCLCVYSFHVTPLGCRWICLESRGVKSAEEVLIGRGGEEKSRVGVVARRLEGEPVDRSSWDMAAAKVLRSSLRINAEGRWVELQNAPPQWPMRVLRDFWSSDLWRWVLPLDWRSLWVVPQPLERSPTPLEPSAHPCPL